MHQPTLLFFSQTNSVIKTNLKLFSLGIHSKNKICPFMNSKNNQLIKNNIGVQPEKVAQEWMVKKLGCFLYGKKHKNPVNISI